MSHMTNKISHQARTIYFPLIELSDKGDTYSILISKYKVVIWWKKELFLNIHIKKLGFGHEMPLFISLCSRDRGFLIPRKEVMFDGITRVSRSINARTMITYIS